MIHWLNTFLVHPLHGDGYQFWSGIGSDFGEVTLAAALLTMLKHHNCEQPGCWRLGHVHPGHGRPVCRHHYRTHEPPRRPIDKSEIGVTTSDGDW